MIADKDDAIESDFQRVRPARVGLQSAQLLKDSTVDLSGRVSEAGGEVSSVIDHLKRLAVEAHDLVAQGKNIKRHCRSPNDYDRYLSRSCARTRSRQSVTDPAARS